MDYNDSLRELYKEAWRVLNEGNEAEALKLFEQLAEQGYGDAMIDAADIIIRGEKKEEAKKAFEYCLKASETIPEAYDRLCMCYWFGYGVVRSYAEAVRYGLLTVNEVPADRITPCVYEILGECYKAGLGVNKDVCKSKEFLEKAKENGLEDEVKDSLDELCSHYPFTENNEINLKKRKRSKWATLLLWFTMLISGIGVYTLWTETDQKVWPILLGISALTSLLTLCWFKLGGYLLWGMLLAGLGLQVYGVYGLIVDDPNTMSVAVGMGIGTTFSWTSFLILLSLQKRRYGYALAWYSLMKKRDDGRNSIKRFLDKVMLYGYGPKFLSDSKQTRNVRILNICYMILAFIAAVFAAWGMIGQDFDIAIEWNCFENPGMYVTLCVIGFFLQFTKKLYTHASYETYDVYKDQYGKVKKVEKNQDVLEVIMGSFLWPLLSHLIFYPMIIGAIIYYLIMVGFALIQGIMPYIFGALILFSVWLMYPISKKLLPRKYRVVLISVTAMMFLSVYGLIIDATGIEEKIPDITLKLGKNEAKAAKDRVKPVSDVALYELKGNVRQVNVVKYAANKDWTPNKDEIKDSYSISFDKNGIAKRYDNYFYYGDDNRTINATRDTKGRVVKLDDSAPHDCGTSYSFTYDGNGNISSKKGEDGCTCRFEYTYQYDENNRLEKTTYETSDVEYESKGENKYTYTQTDEKGNWTERRILTQEKIREVVDESGTYSTRKTQQYRIEKRVILYY